MREMWRRQERMLATFNPHPLHPALPGTRLLQLEEVHTQHTLALLYTHLCPGQCWENTS